MRPRCHLCSRKPTKGRGLCHRCYNRHRRAGTLHLWPLSKNSRRIEDVLEDLDFLIEARVSADNWPSRLDMTPAALERALYRAERPGPARQVSRVRREQRRKEMINA